MRQYVIKHGKGYGKENLIGFEESEFIAFK
jgi:hypothetical protein